MAIPLAGIGSVLSGVGAIASVFGGKDEKTPDIEQQSRLDYQRQVDFAKNQIQWRTQDAKKAGLHPLYSIGASPISYTPSIVDGGQSRTGSKAGDTISAAGRAITGYVETSRQKRLDDQSIAESRARSIAALASAQRDITASQMESSIVKRAQVKSNSQQDLKDTTITTPGGKFKTSKTTKQQDVEDEYGGVAGEVYGIWRLLNDGIENYPSKKETRKPVKNFKLEPTQGP